jgi:hypothetical protein
MLPLRVLDSGAARGEPAAGGRACPPSATFGVFAPRAVEIKTEPMLRIMGYRAGAPIRPAVRRMAERIAELAAAAISPTVHYCRIGIEHCDESGLRLADGVVFHGPVFAKHVGGCREAVAIVMTLGARFDMTQKNLTDADNLLEAVFLETAGWVAVEEVTRLFTQHLRKIALEEGLDISRRLAPGYVFRVGDRKVDWPLEEQEQFFAIFRSIKLPVVLLESYAMMPKMSRTGFFGLRTRAATSATSEIRAAEADVTIGADS